MWDEEAAAGVCLGPYAAGLYFMGRGEGCIQNLREVPVTHTCAIHGGLSWGS